MKPDWSSNLGYAFFLAVIFVPPVAVLAALVWLVTKVARGV